MKAYDIEMLKCPAKRGLADCHGWVFGLPPGIRPEQWPLDPNNGFPLMHGFTLWLPTDYRVHGPDLVALSFFATAPDHNNGGPFEVAGAREAVEAASGTHPRLHRMRDILGCDYAVILLTDVEFRGPPCRPPAVENRTGAQAPDWLTTGSAAAYWKDCGAMTGSPAHSHYLLELLGEPPPHDLAFHRAIHWTPREQDPNAGIPPREEWALEKTGYQPYFYWLDGKIASENWREHEWAKGHRDNHIGGTMRPAQNIPEFSPYYVEFDESFGGYNFGGDGNAQLDFRDMKFDWACG
jgi:hypothetical protein